MDINFYLDIIVSIGIYGIYKDIQKLAVLTSGLRVIYTLFFGVLLSNFQYLLLIAMKEQTACHILIHLKNLVTWTNYFGFHLHLGAICFKRKFTPKFWNIPIKLWWCMLYPCSYLKIIFPSS